MKKLFFILSFFIVFFCVQINSYSLESSDISAKSAIVICAETGEVVFEKNAYQQLPMASTTKIMTSILALEYGASDAYLVVDNNMISVEGSSIGLLPNDKISLKTLVKGMLLESGNDAANSVAQIVGGSFEDFVFLMNYKAQEIGMKSTCFETPSGLDGDNHYSTAFDMAILGAYAIKNPEFKQICSSSELVVYYGNEPYRRVFTNNNKLLKSYDGAFGIKTGFTKKSGRCLVSAVEQNNKTLIAVTLNAPDDWNDHMKMYDYSFQKVQSLKLTCDFSDISVKVVGGESADVPVKLVGEKYITTLQNDYNYSSKVYLKSFEYAPVNVGDILGYVEFYDESGNIIDVLDVCADVNVSAKAKISVEKNFFENILDLFR